MAFNFGASGAPAPGTPAPAPATGTFGVAPAASAAPAGGGFGFTAAPPTGGSTTAGGFSIGAPASAAPFPAPPSAPGAPSPAPTFGLGLGASSSTPAPPAAAPATGATTTASTPAPGGFSFATAPSTTTAPTGAPQTNNAEPITIADFESRFPNLSIFAKVSRLLPKLSDASDEGALAGQELIHILQCQPSTSDKSVVGHSLSQPRPLSWVARNDAFRTKLQTNPAVKLDGKDGAVTPEMIGEIWQLADDLRISEEDAMALYAAASKSDMRTWLETRLDGSFVDAAGSSKSPASALVLGNDVPKAARELFFYERSSALTVLLLLIQHRIQAFSPTDNMPNALLMATDQLIQGNLVENLVSLVREWTQQANDLERELARRTSSQAHTPMFGLTSAPAPSSNNKFKSSATVLLSYAHKQRHMAAECLFYLAYHTQCTAMEVASLIDLIKDITNGRDEASGLPILDPFSDIPSAFENPNPAHPTHNAGWATPFTAPLPPLKEKDPLAWQNELVQNIWEKGGKPQLLKCVSVLVMSVISSLDGRHVLMDRSLHGPNEFGVGNALLPPSSGPGQVSTDHLLPIHSRLDPRTESNQDWKRKDIWGLLASSYALLLPSVVASPRHRSPSNSPAASPRQGRIDIKSTWRACLEAPTQMKSFSFARLSLMPSFERHSTSPDGKCDNYEFYMSVLSEFIAQYLDVLCASGNVPISRELWKNGEETELEVQRVQQEQQRQFGTWSGTQATEGHAIPTEVDLMKRPDCMDDVMALAVAVCSTGPEYAMHFWSVADNGVMEGDTVANATKLVPSRALKTLERLQTNDGSLLPAYLSFLAALALAGTTGEDPDGSGAAAVHSLLSQEFDPSSDSSRKVNWSTVLQVIRWYARELSVPATGTRGSTDTLRSSSSGTTGFDSMSTAYYYGADSTEDAMGGFHSSHSQQRKNTTASSTDAKPKELGEDNTIILLSHLNVISSVTSNSSVARSAISSMKLPVGDGVGEDHLLTMLFSLAIAPVAPEVRGAIFMTISNILRVVKPREEEKEAAKEMARKGWDLLEDSQVLPIVLLDQYSPPPGRVGFVSPGLRFPASSTAQVSTGAEGQYGTPWVPPDHRYGIIYETEHVESRMGFYPSTEGLLHLITTLVSVGGCPSDLGRFRRARSGCAPYIEFVIHFVLPRAMGTHQHDGGLPFRTLADKSRLVSLALEVVEAVLLRYVVPPANGSLATQSPTDSSNATMVAVQTVRDLFGASSVADNFFICPNDDDYNGFTADFRDDAVSAVHSSDADASLYGANAALLSSSDSGSMTTVSGEGSFPRPKSPGFIVLHDIISSVSGDLFKTVASILSEHYASRGINVMYGLPEYKAIVSAALFGGTPPTFPSAKTSSDPRSPSVTRQSLLKSPFPAGEQAVHLSMNCPRFAGSSDGTFWRERSIVLGLRILCAAAAREELFSRALNAVTVPLKIVPVLRFHNFNGRVTSVNVRDVQVSRLADLLDSSAGTWVTRDGSALGVLPTIVEYIGYVSSSWRQDAGIASPAVALVVYVERIVSVKKIIRSLCGSIRGGDKMFASAIARRLKVSSRRVDYSPHADLVRVILDMLVFSLRRNNGCEIRVSDVMLGLPTSSTGDNWNVSNIQRTSDTFDVILELISDVDFVRDNRTSGFATTCYEIMYRLLCTQSVDSSQWLHRILYASERLRHVDFWRSNLLLFLGKGDGGSSILQTAASSPSHPSGDKNVLHSIAWLLMGVSNELKLLMGFTPSFKDGPLSSRTGESAAPRPSQCRRLLSALYADPDLLAVHALNALPLERDKSLNTTALPPTDLIKSAAIPLPGPAEVVGGYSVISIDKLLHKIAPKGQNTLTDVQESTVNWAVEWNLAVERDCAVSHLADSLRVVLGSSFTFCRPLLLHDFWQDRASGRAPLEGRGIVQLLSLILTRLADEQPGRSDTGGMDDFLHSSGTLHLASAALVLVQEIARTGSEDRSELSLGEGDLMRIYVLLAKAVVSSARGGESHSSRQGERSAILGSSLALLIESKFKGSEELRTTNRVRETFVLAASALAKLACSTVSGSSRRDWTVPGEHSAALARIARSSLSALLRCHDDDASCLEDSFIFQVFGSPHVVNNSLSSFISLLANLDDDIYSILSRIALCRFGTELLQDADLPASLIHAAKFYSIEEERVQSQVKATHQKMQISTPSFFAGHFFLLNTMLSTPSLSTERRDRIAADAKEIIRHHSRIILRLVQSFPNDGDATLAFVRCLYLMTSRTSSDNAGGRQNLWRLQAADAYKVAEDAIESGVLDLTHHLSLYPFPPRLLPPLPPTLKRLDARGLQTHTHLVSLTSTESQTWWSVVDSGFIRKERMLLPDPPTGPSHQGACLLDDMSEGWSDYQYDFSVQGAEILEASLLFLNQRVLLSPPLSIDCISLAKGFFRCADAARAIEGRLRLLSDASNNTDPTKALLRMDMMDTGENNTALARRVEKEYLMVLGPSLGRCAEKFLVLASSHLRTLTRDSMRDPGLGISYHPSTAVSDLSSAMLATLDYLQVETMGIGCIGWQEGDESRRDFAKKISQNLRKEFQGKMKRFS